MTEPGSICPSCQRRVPIPKEDKTPRKRQQFNISVPADVEEDGAEVLRVLLKAAGVKLGEMGLPYDEDTPPYYIINAVIADWLTTYPFNHE